MCQSARLIQHGPEAFPSAGSAAALALGVAENIMMYSIEPAFRETCARKIYSRLSYKAYP